jgi:hypothetical protein
MDLICASRRVVALSGRRAEGGGHSLILIPARLAPLSAGIDKGLCSASFVVLSHEGSKVAICRCSFAFPGTGGSHMIELLVAGMYAYCDPSNSSNKR